MRSCEAFVLIVLALLTLSSCSTEMLTPSGNKIEEPTPAKYAPPKVDPIILNGIQYGGGFSQGILPIYDVKTGQQLKSVTIYDYADSIQPGGMPQAVFFKSMKLVDHNKAILIENEAGQSFLYFIRSGAVRELNRPVALQLVSSEKTPAGWKVVVEIAIQNRMNKNFRLDAISFGGTKHLMSDVFEIKGPDGKPLPFQGLAAKGAASKDIVTLAPQQDQKSRVVLSDAYAFPKDGGKFTVRYHSTNGFSPDRVNLISNTIEFKLD